MKQLAQRLQQSLGERQQGDSGRENSGFTLVELLVVMAIISALAGLITVSVSAARRSATKKNCSIQMQEMSSALTGYFSDWGDYPPSDLERFYDGDFAVTNNGLNDGVESMVAHLARQGKGGPYYVFKDENIANGDKDSLNDDDLRDQLNWIFGDNELREFVDPWDNPLVYIHNRNYDRGPFAIQTGEGERVSVSARQSQKLKTYEGLTTFQLFSLGPDGKFSSDEDGDDILP